ncbi:MAG: hypothetical protein ACHP7N_09600 [Caulobacterales bacterium]
MSKTLAAAAAALSLTAFAAGAARAQPAPVTSDSAAACIWAGAPAQVRDTLLQAGPTLDDLAKAVDRVDLSAIKPLEEQCLQGASQVLQSRAGDIFGPKMMQAWAAYQLAVLYRVSESQLARAWARAPAETRSAIRTSGDKPDGSSLPLVAGMLRALGPAVSAEQAQALVGHYAFGRANLDALDAPG